MAGLNDRGQLLLAGAFILAVGLIGLTIVFSASNYTETLAGGDDAVSGGGDALTTRDAVTADLEDLLSAVNADGSPSEAKWRRNLTWYANQTSAFHARNGRFVNVSVEPVPAGERTHDGWRLVQTDPRNFSSLDQEANWSIPYNPTSKTTIRNATFVFTEDEGTGPDGSFTLTFNATHRFENANNWSVAVYNSVTEAHVRVSEEDGFTATCHREDLIAPSDPLEVDLSAGTYDGATCPALEALDPELTYNLNVTNGNRTSGKYWITTAYTGYNFNDYDASAEHRVDSVLYDATVRYRYHAPRVDYETNVTVAPGEIP